eukprot:488143_1
MATLMICYFGILLTTITASSLTNESSCLSNNKDLFYQFGSHYIMPVTDGHENDYPITHYFPFLNVSMIENMTDSNGNSWYYYNSTDNQYYWTSNSSYSGFLILTQNTDGSETKILLDAGLGIVDPPHPNGNNLLPKLIAMQCNDIDMVIHSHLHRDHTGWDINNLSNPNITNITWLQPVPYIIQYDEFEYWMQNKDAIQWNVQIQPLIDNGQIELRMGNYWISDDIQIVECIGHTPGHQCVIIFYDKNKNKAVYLGGDIMHHPIQIQMPIWSAKYDWNTTFSVPTREQIINQVYTNDWFLMLVHFAYPQIGKIVKCSTCGGDTGFVYKQYKSVN